MNHSNKLGEGVNDERASNLSVEEIHYLIVDKRRASRNIRLEHYCQTGRVIPTVNEKDSFDRTKARKIKRSHLTWLDNVLLGLELLAIVGLVFVIVNGLSTLSTLNRSIAASLQQPTLAPTPIIREVVLPEGHTPPNSPGGARFNEAEIPKNLRPLVQSLSNITNPTPGSQQAIRIQIPAIAVDAPVVQGDGWEQLKRGVAQHLGTPNPGENGNIVLSGHNDVFGEVFRDVDRLKPGDIIILFTSQRKYTYIITGTQIVEPTAVEVMASTPNATMTLISCHPYLVDNHRIVVSAILYID